MKNNSSAISKSDAGLSRLINKETKRQQETLNLIASENFAPVPVRELVGSVLANKYSEGYPGRRYYPGNAVVDEIEVLAQRRALAAFKLGSNWRANVQPYSGSPANLAVYLGLMKPGEKLLGMELSAGGHITPWHKVKA